MEETMMFREQAVYVSIMHSGLSRKTAVIKILFWDTNQGSVSDEVPAQAWKKNGLDIKFSWSLSLFTA